MYSSSLTGCNRGRLREAQSGVRKDLVGHCADARLVQQTRISAMECSANSGVIHSLTFKEGKMKQYATICTQRTELGWDVWIIKLEMIVVSHAKRARAKQDPEQR